MPEMKVGSELRQRRNELKLSLREVAELTELSIGFLSQLENDQVSPSLSSLNRLADALRIPMFELLSSDDRDPVVHIAGRRVVELGNTGTEVELLTNFRNWQLMPFRRVLAVGEKSEAVRIDRAREEWIYVLAGKMELYLRNQDSHVLVPGDSVHFASTRLEALNSVGEEPLEFICIMTPPA